VEDRQQDFAMVSGGGLFVRLPHDPVESLIAAGDGAPFEAGKTNRGLAGDRPNPHTRSEALR
jgi:hypothetical protein